MIRSMTGFGKTEFEVGTKKITLEIKSLNSKQLDINTRVPSMYREKDLEIRRLISETLTRGKVDFAIYLDNLGTESTSRVNAAIIKDYYRQLADVHQDLGLEINESIMQSIMRLPETVKMVYDELDETEWLVVRENLIKTLENLNTFRDQEGLALKADIDANIANILDLLNQVEPFETQRMENVKTKIKESLDALQLNGSLDKNRFEQELIYYMEKLDINEEKVRLANHCSYFTETMNEDEPSGRKLGFIAQEIGREINTLGSKANESNLQRIVVQMKDNLEKIKEQVLNVL
ncbi:protein YicC [Aquipluma nitroreducens]|uniref:Protein YicC n=1 Tax=Aquipluma nitroreducens TaxID=2010828 RepID=A0A5K7S754_9BACT|nr:YicC/YloC family endoribonuclease [Aquipluma nitroreducens]BBE17398.1 protein YicC [Aquipluma nitroreducens]